MFRTFNQITNQTIKGAALQQLLQNSAGSDDIGSIVFGGDVEVTGGIGALTTAECGMTAGTATSSTLGLSNTPIVTLTDVTGYVAPGDTITDGTNVAKVYQFVSGTEGGAGVYQLEEAPYPAAWNDASVTSTSNTVNVTAVTSGAAPIVVGAALSGGDATDATVTAILTGAGGVGQVTIGGAAQAFESSDAIEFTGNVLNVATVVSGVLGGGNDFSSGATGSIVEQLSGTNGGVGTYEVSEFQYVAAGTTIETASASALVDGDHITFFVGTWADRENYEGNTDVVTTKGVTYWFKECTYQNSLVLGDSSLDNTTAGIVRQVTIDNHAMLPGYVFMVGTEAFLVMVADDDDHVDVYRGYAGTTVAAHASAAEVLTPLSYTNVEVGYDIIVPVTSLTLATAGPEIAKAMPALDGWNAQWNGSAGNGIQMQLSAKKLNLDWEYISGSTRLFFHRPSQAGAIGPGTPSQPASATTVFILSSITNGAASPNLYGGVQEGEVARSVVTRVPTATEVELGYMDFAFPYPISAWEVSGFTTSTLASATIGSTVSFSEDGRRITLTNNGTHDFAATQTIEVDVVF